MVYRFLDLGMRYYGNTSGIYVNGGTLKIVGNEIRPRPNCVLSYNHTYIITTINTIQIHSPTTIVTYNIINLISTSHPTITPILSK